MRRHQCNDPKTCQKCCQAVRGRAHYTANKDKVKAAARAWYKANKALAIASRRAWYATNKDRAATLSQNWAASHKAHSKAQKHAWYVANKDLTKARAWAWNKTPAGRVAAQLNQHRRRARTVSKELTGKVLESIKLSWGMRCAYCHLVPTKLTTDHIIPISKGGKHSVFNVVPACMPCNSRKGNKNPFEFLRSLSWV